MYVISIYLMCVLILKYDLTLLHRFMIIFTQFISFIEAKQIKYRLHPTLTTNRT